MIADPFAGPGGWSEGLRQLGLSDIGYEYDRAACATRAAAGHTTIRADVRQVALAPLAGKVEGLILSPPCQTFSTAGNGGGRAELAALRSSIDRGDWSARGPGHEVLEVGRWAETLRPTWIACEQVPPVLPLWEAYAARWRALYGWSCWAGLLLAADYGVPQTRLRAFLLARTDGRPAHPPAATHCKGGAQTMFGELAPWVSMADALGWTGEMHHWRGVGMAERHGDCPGRSTDDPAFTIEGGVQRRTVIHRDPWVVRTGANSMVTGRTGSRAGDGDVQPYERPIDQPAPTVDSKGGAWTVRPATTVCGDPSLGSPGHHDPNESGSQYGPDSVKLTLTEALILQSFPPDYPVQGNKSERFTQVGNAVPPLLAAHVVSALTS